MNDDSEDRHMDITHNWTFWRDLSFFSVAIFRAANGHKVRQSIKDGIISSSQKFRTGIYDMPYIVSDISFHSFSLGFLLFVLGTYPVPRIQQ